MTMHIYLHIQTRDFIHHFFQTIDKIYYVKSVNKIPFDFATIKCVMVNYTYAAWSKHLTYLHGPEKLRVLFVRTVEHIRKSNYFEN